MTDSVRIKRSGGIGRIVLDRPDHNNAMDQETAEALRAAAAELSSDDDCRCMSYTGIDSTFNTGADLTTLEGGSDDEARLKTLARSLHGFVEELACAPKPVVCGVNGVVAGGGIGTALVGDVVIMSESARFQFAYPAIGLSADGGSTYFLPRLVGLREAQRIALRDEPVGAEEAASLGLVTETVPDDEFEDRLRTEAATLAAGPTGAFAETRRLLRTSFDHDLTEHLGQEAASLSGLAATDDYAEGYAAFFDKRDPEFTGE